MAIPLFSVVIPTRHRNDLLAQCLDCLKPGIQTLSADQYEVIVTDDGSNSTAEELIQHHYPWVKWVPGAGKGPAANRNNGARYARGKWLVFTDDDCIPDPQWLSAYVEAIRIYPGYKVLEGRVYVDRPRQSLAEKSPINETGGYLWSCNLAINIKLFESLEGFDERFPYAAMEDVALRTRLLSLGHQPLFCERASVCHPWRLQSNLTLFTKKKKSVLLYLDIFPEEYQRLNSTYYLKAFTRSLTHHLPDGIFNLGCKGILQELIKAIFFIYMSCILLGCRFSNVRPLEKSANSG